MESESSTVSAQIMQQFDPWLLSQGVETFEDLRETILMEQFVKVVLMDLVSLFLDRSPKTLSRAASLGEHMRLSCRNPFVRA